MSVLTKIARERNGICKELYIIERPGKAIKRLFPPFLLVPPDPILSSVFCVIPAGRTFTYIHEVVKKVSRAFPPGKTWVKQGIETLGSRVVHPVCSNSVIHFCWIRSVRPCSLMAACCHCCSYHKFRFERRHVLCKRHTRWKRHMRLKLNGSSSRCRLRKQASCLSRCTASSLAITPLPRRLRLIHRPDSRVLRFSSFSLLVPAPAPCTA